MVMYNVCKMATRSVKVVKIAITTAEAKLQIASLPTPSVTPAAMPYTSEQSQELSAKVAQLAVEISTVRREREALQASAAAPAVSTEDRLTVLSEEMPKMTKQIEDLRAENTALKSQEPNPSAASEDTTTMFGDFMAQQTAINSANKTATEDLSKTISHFVTQLIENQNARPIGDPIPMHATINPPARGPATPATIVPFQVPDTPAFPSNSEMVKRNLLASYKATDSFDKDLKERASVFEKANIVRSTQSHRSALGRLAATPSDLRPIYGANIHHQPVSKIMKNLRDVLVMPEAARGLSIFGLDSFELLVEESTEEYARGALNSLKIKTTDQREPLDFLSLSGTKITDEAELKKNAVGALRRWKRCAEGCRVPEAKDWYRDQISKLQEKRELSIYLGGVQAWSPVWGS